MDLDRAVAEAGPHVVDDQLVAGALDAVSAGPTLILDLPHDDHSVALG